MGCVFIRCTGCIFRLRGRRGRSGEKPVEAIIVEEEVRQAADKQKVEEDSYTAASSHSEHAFVVIEFALWLRGSVTFWWA